MPALSFEDSKKSNNIDPADEHTSSPGEERRLAATELAELIFDIFVDAESNAIIDEKG